MNIQTIPISQIQRARYNPRKTLKPGDPSYDRLRKGLETFGLVEPLVWNKRSGNLVGGHQRLSVLEQRGEIEVEVSVVDLAPREEKALNLALNKHSGEWDFAALSDILTELETADFDMEAAGFSEKELKALMAWRPPNAGLTDEDAVPDGPKAPVTQPGDLIRLGPHRLLCGDATDKATVDRLLAESAASALVMVADPPYGVDYNPSWRNTRQGPGKSRLPPVGKARSKTTIESIGPMPTRSSLVMSPTVGTPASSAVRCNSPSSNADSNSAARLSGRKLDSPFPVGTITGSTNVVSTR